jgi:hypothetical protein
LDGVEHRYVDHGDGVTIHVITADLTYGYAERISDFEASWSTTSATGSSSSDPSWYSTGSGDLRVET